MRSRERRFIPWLAVVTVVVVAACAAPAPRAPPPPGDVRVAASSSVVAPASSVVTPAPPPRFTDSPLVDEPTTFDTAKAIAWVTAPGDAVPPAPPRCGAWVRRARAPVTCESRASARALLDAAIDFRVPTEARDAALASLEACKGLDGGFVRALRVELAPIECRDVLATPLLAKPPSVARAAYLHALGGHLLAARAARIAAAPGPPDARRSLALDALAQQAAEMPEASYGAAVARGGVAAAWAKFAPFDHAGARSIGVAALRAMAAVGVADAPNADAVAAWIAVTFGWVAEIDALRLAPLAPAPLEPPRPGPTARRVPACPHCTDDRRRAATDVARFAEELPSFFSASLLEPRELASAAALRGLARRGSLPVAARHAIASHALGADERALAAHARMSLGLRLADRRSIDGAAALVAADGSAAARLLLALAKALRGWPGAGDSLFSEPPGATRFDLGALDELVVSDDEDVRMLAVYDAGVLRLLETGPTSGDLAPLRAVVEGHAAALARGSGRTFVRDRMETAKRLLAAIDADTSPPYAASSAVHLDGWPAVQTASGTWRDSSGTFFAANRTTMVHTTLRLTSHRFLRCFDGAPGGPITVRFVIERDGSVKTATARPASPDDATRARCLTEVTRGLAFHDINFGVWTVEATFR